MMDTKSREPPIAELIRSVEPPVGWVRAGEELAQIRERQVFLRQQRDALAGSGFSPTPHKSHVENVPPATVREASAILRGLNEELAELAERETAARELLSRSQRSWVRALEGAVGGRRAAAITRFQEAIATALAALREVGAIDDAIRRQGGNAPASMAPAIQQLEAVSKMIEQAIKGTRNGQRRAA